MKTSNRIIMAFMAAIITLTMIASFRVCTGAEEPEGLRLCEDGELRYYRDGRPVYAGVVEKDGALYYVNSTCKAIRSTTYDIGAARTNGLAPAGRYVADADGVLTPMNGVQKDEDGQVRYYANGVPVYAGLVYDEHGYMYYIGSSKTAIRGKEYRPTKLNGIECPTSFGCADGVLRFDERGRAYFMEYLGSRWYIVRCDESPLGYTVQERGW